MTQKSDFSKFLWIGWLTYLHIISGTAAAETQAILNFFIPLFIDSESSSWWTGQKMGKIPEPDFIRFQFSIITYILLNNQGSLNNQTDSSNLKT